MTSVNQDQSTKLIAQFSQFILNKDISHHDWITTCEEFGVMPIAKNMDRFFKSWKFRDADRIIQTKEFLKRVRSSVDEETMLRIMQRIYDISEGASESEIQKFGFLKALDKEETKPSEIELYFTKDKFIELDYIPGNYYPTLIEHINQSYQLEIYEGALVLTRKTLENLLIDVMCKHYGDIEKYYMPEERRHKNFSDLLEVFEEDINRFHSEVAGANEDLVKDLDNFRKQANSSAHTLEIDITEKEMQDYSKNAESCIKKLIRLNESLGS